MQYQVYNNKEEVIFQLDNVSYSTSSKEILSDTNLNIDFIATNLLKINELQEKLEIVADRVFFYTKDSDFYLLTRDDIEYKKNDAYKLTFHCLIDGYLCVSLSTFDASRVLERNVKVFETSKCNVISKLSDDGYQLSTNLIGIESTEHICSIIEEIVTLHLMSQTVYADELNGSSFQIYRKNDKLFHVNYLDKIEFDTDANTANLFLKKLKSDPNSVELLFETAQAIKESTNYCISIDIPNTLTRLTYLQGSQYSKYLVRLDSPSDRLYKNNESSIHVSVMQKSRKYRRLYYKDEYRKVKIFTDMRASGDSKIEFSRKTENFTATNVESALQFMRDAVESMQELDLSIDLYASEPII